MDNPGEIMRLCRLCLVKDQVNIPIFDEQGDIRQIFLKISSCLPVKVSREDPLPKSICDGCSNKLDLLYEFRNTSANAEKTLLSWVGQADAKDVDETVTAAAHQVAKPSETQVKQEEVEESNPAPVQDIESMDAQESATFDESSAKDEEEEEPPPPKRARRTAAVKAQINIAPDSDDEDDDDDDLDGAEPMTKIEDESEESDDDKDPSYQDVPGTSADDQPGPSGVGKDGVEAPNALFPCLKCRKHFTTFKKLRKHSYTHGVKRYQCNVCEKKFLFKHALLYHVKGVHTEKPVVQYLCPHCGKRFKEKYWFEKHVERHDPNYKPEFQCPVCYKDLTCHKYLEAHLKKRHANDDTRVPPCRYRRYCCYICGKELLKRNLKNHLMSHTGEKPYRCELCDKSFITRKCLEIHVRVHTKEKPYNCPVCNKAFSQRYSVTIHMRYHTGERPYQCVICTKSFATHSELKCHVCSGPGQESVIS